MLWDEDHVRVEDVHFGTCSLSSMVSIISFETSFKIITVYELMRNHLKDDFFHEMMNEKLPPRDRWLVTGDFNQIYRARDKNSANSSRSCIVRF